MFYLLRSSSIASLLDEIQVLFVKVVLVELHILRSVTLVRIGVPGVLGAFGKRGHLGVALLRRTEQLLKVRGD